jgi:regulator of nucleoside diphosphate kinase
MHSCTEFRYHATGEKRTVQIVYPQDADISKDRVSVLTPFGATLIGLSVGQSMTWRGRDGKARSLTILGVHQEPMAEA